MGRLVWFGLFALTPGGALFAVGALVGVGLGVGYALGRRTTPQPQYYPDPLAPRVFPDGIAAYQDMSFQSHNTFVEKGVAMQYH
jgi:hypothetical protein